MAYAKGSLNTADNLNAFLTSVRAVYGVGTGDRGYGQTAVVQEDVAAGDLMTSSHWSNLRSMISVAAVHQGTNTISLPPASLLEPGDTIVAHEQSAPSNNPYDLNGMIATIDANRLTGDSGGMSLISTGFSIVESDPWTGTMTAVADLSWPTEDAARHFFNTAGQVIVTVAVSVADTDSTDWNTNLDSKVGAIRISAHSTTNDGSVNGGSGTGFYELTNTAAPVFSITNFGGAGRVAKNLTVSARRLGYVGVRDGNGTGIRVTIVADDDTGATMTGTLSAGINVFRTNTLDNVVDPDIITTAEWG